MIADSTAKVMLVYQDKDKRQSRLMFRLPFAISGPAALSFAMRMSNTISPLTNAVLVQIQITWDWREINPTPPANTSDVLRKVALFYRNADYYEAIFIPSAKASIFESEGLFAGVRVDALQSSLAAWTINAPNTLANIVTEEGAAFPTIFVVGGKTL